MRGLTVLALTAIALGSGAARAQPDRATDVAALTEAKLRSWPGYYRANDAAGLAQFLADGFVLMNADGSRQGKAETVAWVRSNKWANGDANFRYDISDIAFYSDDVANVYGVGSYDGKGPAGACRMNYTSSNLFVRQQGRWRPIFSHTSDSVCADGAKR